MWRGRRRRNKKKRTAVKKSLMNFMFFAVCIVI
jgi:hypothetical protein